MNLFQQGDFTLNSGKKSWLKIECDALTDDDWDTLAYMVSKQVFFYGVVGVPTGGFKFAKALEQYATYDLKNPLLIVDDVLTTGGSMESMRKEIEFYEVPFGGIKGIVVFAREVCPAWITPIFRMW